MSQNDLNRVKRLLCQRMLNQMPEEALGELLVEMREIADFYRNDDLIKAHHTAQATGESQPAAATG